MSMLNPTNLHTLNHLINVNLTCNLVVNKESTSINNLYILIGFPLAISFKLPRT